MKAGWKTVKLGDVTKEFIVPQRDKPKNLCGDIPWCRIEDIDGIYLSGSKSGKGVTAKDIKEMPLRIFPSGTVIVSCSADLGRCAIVSKPLITNQTFLGIVPDETIDAKYLYYLLRSRAEQLNSMATGATIKYLSRDKFSSLEIPLPPLAEQKRIVALLDEAFAGIDEAKAKAQANLENAGLLLKSYLNSTFSQAAAGWQEKTLGETCEMYQPKTIGMKDLVPDGPYPVFGANGIIGKYDKYNHEEPQLLITCRGATCGAVNISEPNSWITGNAMVVRPKDGEIDLQFLEYFFRGGVDISVAITGTAQPQITRTNLEPLIVRFPKSVSEQKNHVKVFKSLTDETCALANIYGQKLEMVNELKSSLLSQAFAGELTA